jgi:hypothetical protein
VGCSITATSGTWSCADVFSGAAKSVASDDYVEVMGSTVKVSNSQSLFVSTSLVTGLYTNTLVTTKPSKTAGGTNTSTATATGGVYLRAVLLNAPNSSPVAYGYPAAACNTAVLGCSGTGADSGVVLDSRVQTLTQSLSDCVVNVTVSGLLAYAGFAFSFEQFFSASIGNARVCQGVPRRTIEQTAKIPRRRPV